MSEVKNLQATGQEMSEVSRRLEAEIALHTVERRPESPRSVVLLLHGLDERGLRIYRKLLKYLPEDSYVLAPNAPFPLPRIKSDRIDYGYSWYFYNKFKKNYHVDQTLALSLLSNLLRNVNPENLPVTVIGFSQGGYLAPLLGFREASVKHVIGIGCEFRTKFFSSKPSFTLDAIHGEDDQIIPSPMAYAEIEALKEKDIFVNWHPIAGVKHEITAAVGDIVQKILEQYGN